MNEKNSEKDMREKDTEKDDRPTGNDEIGKRGVSLPPTFSKPPMPPVKPPKKKE